MRVTSYGAARGVTGSKHLLEHNGARVLLDCGMFQGRRIESHEKNRQTPMLGNHIHGVVLSHAHIDHSGLLPLLGRQGFRNRIFATPATRDLCAIMLMDSAHIQERDAKWLSKRQETFVPPLYTDEDARAIMRQFICLPYEMPFEVAPGIRVTFHDAGHVLGSAMTEVAWEDGGARRRFIYTADIGRHDMPILKDPWEPQGANAVMMESTYGNRDHDSFGKVDDKLADVITRTHARGGKVIVPSFALERAQEFIYALKRLETSGRIPQLPVFVDSPLTVNITEVFRLHTDSFDEEIRAVMEESGDPFELSHIEYVRNVEASKRLNTMDEPMIIISASGMCEYGRIQHHLRNNVADDRNTILIIGFQAKNTLGRRIVEHQREIPIFGIKHPLNAEVQVINALSAHAGKTDLLEFGERFKGVAEKILLVHGEDEALNDLKAGLEERGVDGVHIQEEEETVEL